MSVFGDQFSFITSWTYMDKKYSGIVCNTDKQFVSIYVIDLIRDTAIRDLLLRLAQAWDDSNTSLPISVYLGKYSEYYSPYLKVFSLKEFTLIDGPMPCIASTYNKRTKEKKISLLR